MAFGVAEIAIPEFLAKYSPAWPEIQVEEGSKKVRTRFLTVAAALALYGGIRSTIDYGIRDARQVAGWVNGQLRDRFHLGRRELIRQERRAGLFGRLQRLVNAVSSGRISSGQATQQAAEILEESGFSPREAESVLRQLDAELGATGTAVPRPPRPPRRLPVPHVPLPAHGSEGIVVWRDPNTGQRRQRPL